MRADNEGRLAHWQSAPGSSPATTDDYLYDGEGNRVAQVVTTSSSTSSVYYLLGGAEEVSISGGTTTLTKYFSVAGLPTAMRVGSAISYLATDGLGSVTAAFDGNGNLEAAQLYLPYGEGTRYSTGSMPTSKGFTGQRADATTGLYYYGARYYDPTTQQFTSPDSVVSGLNRYAYVDDDPTSRVDPTGQLEVYVAKQQGGGAGGALAAIATWLIYGSAGAAIGYQISVFNSQEANGVTVTTVIYVQNGIQTETNTAVNGQGQAMTQRGDGTWTAATNNITQAQTVETYKADQVSHAEANADAQGGKGGTGGKGGKGQGGNGNSGNGDGSPGGSNQPNDSNGWPARLARAVGAGALDLWHSLAGGDISIGALLSALAITGAALLTGNVYGQAILAGMAWFIYTYFISEPWPKPTTTPTPTPRATPSPTPTVPPEYNPR